VIEYVVDGRNRRVGKKVNGVIERQWIYDGQLRPVAEYGPTGTLAATYIYGTHINVPDYVVKSSGTYRVITDHLGSLRFVINISNGTIAQRVDYDDWGNVLLNTAPDFTPFGFAGGMYDKDTKLTRFGARDYDAEVGRWTTKDPIGFGGGLWNLYSYCGEQPVKRFDLSGLWLAGAHNAILDYAFGGVLDSDDINILKDASAFQDDSFGGASESYMHAMRPPWQTVETATNLYKKFLCDQLSRAQRARQLGRNYESLFSLGRGMHALMDSTSPSHSGFQVWLGGTESNLISNLKAGMPGLEHTISESSMNAVAESQAIEKVNKYFEKFKKGCPCEQ
jgi:RHS repeat-associated protein